jgi:cobalt-zinc-cadmium efflux system membrane fusion protein
MVTLCLLGGSGYAEVLPVSTEQQALLGIATAEVSAQGTQATATLSMRAAFAPDAEWVLKARLGGVLQKVLVQQGETVVAGQPLLQISSARFVELQRDYLRARAQSQLAADTLARDQRLYEAGSISARRWQDTRFQGRAAAAELVALQGQLQLAGLDQQQISQLSEQGQLSPELLLRAPALSVVLERPVSPGAVLDGSELLMRLGDPGELILSAQLAANAVPWLAAGARLRQADGSAEAVVDFVSAVLDPHTQTLTVRAVPVSPAGLRPGQLSAWELLPDQAMLVVPARAVVRLDDQDVVYVAVPGGFEARAVSARGAANGAWVISSGLREGEQVAVQGTALLKGISLGLGSGEGE